MLSQDEIRENYRWCEEIKHELPFGPWIHEHHDVSFNYRDYDCLLIRSPFTFAWKAVTCLKPKTLFYGVELRDLKKLLSIDLNVSVKKKKEHWIGFEFSRLYQLKPAFYRTAYDKSFKDDTYFSEDQSSELIKNLIDQVIERQKYANG